MGAHSGLSYCFPEEEISMALQRDNTITIVSGLPRSGTSMMMRMLEAGGITPVTDNIRKADEDNKRGYYEFERAKKIKEDTSWLPDCRGKVVKMISMLLLDLPLDKAYKVIFIRRNMDEILASQKVMLQRRGEKGAGVSDEKMAQSYAKHVTHVENWLASNKAFDVLYVSYNKIIDNPGPHITSINDFLGGGLDTAAMAQVIETSLYRQRK